MKHNQLTKYLSITFFVVMAALLLYSKPLTVSAAEYSGDCSYSKSDNVKWTLDSTSGTLTISGQGQMKNYSENSSEDWLFNRTSIVYVVIEEGVTNLGEYCFYNCTSLSKATLPASLVTIDNYAFKNCKDLRNLKIPANVKTIGKYAFGDCRTFTNITIPDSVTSLGTGAFKDCTKLKNVNISTALTTLNNNTFLRCSSLTSVTIPDNITSIGALVFKECKALKSVYIPPTVTSIDSAAFEMCNSLTDIIIPDGLTTISAQLFRSCKNLTTVKLPYTISVIPSTAFENCPNVKLYCANNYVKNYASTYKHSFKNSGKTYNGIIYVIENGNAIITSFTKDLAIANIPSEINGYPVTKIWERAFENCYTLTNATIPESITSIDNNAFKNCFDLLEINNFSKIKITKGSEENGSAGFYAENIRTNDSDASILTTDDKGFVFATIDEKPYLIGYTGTETAIELPETFTNAKNETVKKYYIYKYALAGRSTMTSCTLSSAVTFMGNNAFAFNSKLKNVLIPASVNKIGSNAFLETSSKFTIKGFKGTYAQSYASENKIKFTEVSSADVTTALCLPMVSIEYNSIEYTGKTRKPKVTVKNGSSVLKENRDYTLKYKNANSVGTATVVVTGKGNYTGSVEKTFKIKLVENHKYNADTFTVKILKLNKDGVSGEAAIFSLNDSTLKTVTIDKTISLGGAKFAVTQIWANAFANKTALRTVNINANIKTIDNKAFYGCTHLSSLNISSTKLKKVGANAIRHINDKAVIKVPSNKLNSYKSFFTAAVGFYKTMKIKSL